MRPFTSLAMLFALAAPAAAHAQAQAPAPIPKTAAPGPMSILTQQATQEPFGAPHTQPLSMPMKPGSRVAGAAAPVEAPAEGGPLETRPPTVASQRPAFEGQTRAPAVRTRTPIETRVVAGGLNKPWALAFLPDGAIIVTEKPGTMRLVSQAGEVGQPIAGVPPVMFRGDAGLLDVEVDPAFKDNRTIYLSFVGFRPDGNALMVIRAQLSRDRSRLENISQLLTMPAFNNPVHYGGRMLLAPDGKLYIGAAERTIDATRILAQSPASPLGKILRINTDGSVPQDNPYAQVRAAEPRVWSIGHRDVEGLAFNAAAGKIWISDHGPQGGDEIDVLEPGYNYGWPLAAYGEEYTGDKINDGRTQWPGTDQPNYYWDPAIAPSGITFYEGALIPEWRGNLFVASLAGRHLSRLVIEGDRVLGEERLLQDQNQRVRDVAQGPDGALWAVTDDADGRLIRIAPVRTGAKPRLAK